GEWIFSQKAFPNEYFPDFNVNEGEYLALAQEIIKLTFNNEQLKQILEGKTFADYFCDLRRQASLFIDMEAQRILQLKPRIVGCSSTFQNHCFSLALLLKIRQLAPGVITMMGGANCDDSLGIITHKTFPWVDYIVCGEAELLLPDLCRNIFEHGRDIQLDALPGGVIAPLHRSGTHFKASVRAIVEDMDRSPVPDFDEYFNIMNTSPLKNHVYPTIAFETSRGCWWGAKSQCTFCGFNGKSLAYRSKSAQRVMQDLDTLSQKYKINNFLAIDNILDMKYFKTLFPPLSKLEKKYYMGFETKANLNRRQVKIMRDGGVTCMQPGMESLHDEALKRLRKGSTMWLNIQLLKWTREFGVVNNWVFLHGLPDDKDEWYGELADIVPLITHLQAPNLYHKIYFTRFSLYFYNPGKYNLVLKPYDTYRYVYPLPAEDLENFAHLFDIDEKRGGAASDLLDTGEGKRGLERELFKWAEPWLLFKTNQLKNPPLLTMEETAQGLAILDTRACAVEKHITLETVPAAVYKICDTASTLKRILVKLQEGGHPYQDTREIMPIMDEMVRKKIMLKKEDRYLGLAVRKSNYKFPWQYLPTAETGSLIEIESETETDMYSPGDESLKQAFGF
ncbi:MAG: RiPP maturation radical SAM protein 1, partial [bacterium]|nr:RiPP maturation radical SAM protein 1 [bacterium]